MRIVVVGGGPAGLYFALLIKKADPSQRVTVLERNPADATYGWGVVFSDQTLDNLRAADGETYARITENFAHWDDIDIHVRGRTITSSGHGFSGIARVQLLRILQERARELGLELRFEVDVADDTALSGLGLGDADLIVAADGINSRIRARYAHRFQPDLDVRSARYTWLGTTRLFDAFTFAFVENECGVFQAHAYRFDAHRSAFIVECDEESWRAAGFDRMGNHEAIRLCEQWFAPWLEGHPLESNATHLKSIWLNFVRVSTERWYHLDAPIAPVVLIGDAAHTAHFSIGSGTKLAMEDAIVLARVITDYQLPKGESRGPRAEHRATGKDGSLPDPREQATPRNAAVEQEGREADASERSAQRTGSSANRTRHSLSTALQIYQDERRTEALRLQNAARNSMEWFENVKRYIRLPPEQFAYSLLTRSQRVSHENLRLRDSTYLTGVERWFASRAEQRARRASLDPSLTRGEGGRRRSQEDALPGGSLPLARTPSRSDAASPTRRSAGPDSQEVAPPRVKDVCRWVRPESAAACDAASVGRVPPMFTPFRLRGLTLMNRVVVSPMDMYCAEEGVPNDFHLVHLGSRALGGAGLAFTEMVCVSPEARITLGCTGLYTAEHAAAWSRIVDFVHTWSRARIALQLGHSGRKGATRLMWEGMDEPLDAGAWEVMGPSPLPYGPSNQKPRVMTVDDMARVRDEFVRSTQLGSECGFDLLELHCAHGYLLSSFITPVSNQRTDQYGGPLENRLRFPLEVFRAMREVWPEPRPMSVRISATDWVEGGVDGGEAVEIARAFHAAGADIIHVSTGQTSPDAQPVYGRMFQTPYSDRIRNEADVPTIAVGNITEADQVNAIIAAGRADLCALARPHLSDPHWTLHAAAELGYGAQPWPVQYLTGKAQLERLVQRRKEMERQVEMLGIGTI